MQTRFPPELLRDPEMASSEAVIRKCVHCGFCTATCPTYTLLGDELDSPRGRIYLMKEMLENGQEPTPEVVTHIDRCLSCLSCKTTCPSGVNYMHLVDHARIYIEQNYRRPFHERVVRALLAKTLPYPRRMRLALQISRYTRWLEPLFSRFHVTQSLGAMLRLAPGRLAGSKGPSEGFIPSAGNRRVVLAQGCVENVLRPEIRAATVRVLTRLGFEVAFARDEGCCGAIAWHLGRKDEGLQAARRNVQAWRRELELGLDGIIITASGCGTTIKDYAHMLREDPEYGEDAAKIADLAMDISEFLAQHSTLPPLPARDLTIAYLSPCSMQHGQKIIRQPIDLLAAAGFNVVQPVEAHICCGSAGTYNILQPELADQLGQRKAANLAKLHPDIIATGNVGCATQIASRIDVPVVHTIELLDWAIGGPEPFALATPTK